MTTQTVDQNILGRIQKLLNLASKNTNPNEARAAAVKAQALMTQYNLDVATIERGAVGSASREKEAIQGGFYLYQRRLWRSLAELNFCMYWAREDWRIVPEGYGKGRRYPVKRHWICLTQYKIEPVPGTTDSEHRYTSPETGEVDVSWWGYRYAINTISHVLVGKTVNVAMTKAMGKYLEQAIERELGEWIAPLESKMGRVANSFREGVTDVLVDKVSDKFNRRLTEERRQKPTVSGANALALTSLKQQEEDANYDFLHGEGAAARERADRAKDARERAEARAAYIAWAAEHPEEAKAKEEERRKANRRRGGGGSSYREKQLDHGAYSAGGSAGKGISLDEQVDKGSKAKAYLS